MTSDPHSTVPGIDRDPDHRRLLSMRSTPSSTPATDTESDLASWIRAVTRSRQALANATRQEVEQAIRDTCRRMRHAKSARQRIPALTAPSDPQRTADAPTTDAPAAPRSVSTSAEAHTGEQDQSAVRTPPSPPARTHPRSRFHAKTRQGTTDSTRGSQRLSQEASCPHGTASSSLTVPRRCPDATGVNRKTSARRPGSWKST